MSQSLSSEERRLVTVLFCDLVGFTPLSADLDAEDVRDVQDAYFTAMSAQIERYGGTIDKYAGDAVLALFGAPLAHEDDAERAVLCALAMQGAIGPVAAHARRRWRVDLAIRVGVNTGEVVSGAWGASAQHDVAVTGEVVNTASRFQEAAEPGVVLVGQETMRLTTRRIEYASRRDLVLKGRSGTVSGYSALRVREQFGERWATGEHAVPLVGRDREMTELLEVWTRAQRGEGQLVTVVGEPGVGKSRLVAAVVDTASSGSDIRVLRGLCLSYGQEISLWLLADLIRSVSGIREQDGTEEIASKLTIVLQGLLATEVENLDEARDVLGEVLGLPPSPSMVASADAGVRRHALIRSVRRVLGALSQRVPTMLVLEDLHWIDEASHEVLCEIVSDVPGLRAAVLITHRPGWAAKWAEWGWPERIVLRPLGQHDAALLAGAILGGVVLSAELEQYVAERAGGNPFFVEELLRALGETGGIQHRTGAMHLVPAVAQHLPSTLTQILLARLDRLEAQVRTVAQVASVIGTSFAVKLLATVVGGEEVGLEMPLTALQQAEIAFPRRSPDLEYVFKHVTMQEVAYNTLVQKRRKELHLLTARAIAALYPSDEYVEMIAYHYGRTDAPEAAKWLEKAGDRAASIYATDVAIVNYREARRRLEEADEERGIARLDEKLGDVLFTSGRYDESLESLERSSRLYRERQDLEAAGRVTARMGMAHRHLGTPLEGIALVQPMIEMLEPMGPTVALTTLQLALASLFYFSSRFREMQAAAQQAGALARILGNDQLLGEAEERRGTALTELGQHDEARRTIEAAIPLIEAGGDLFVLQRALNNAGDAHSRLGQTAHATRHVERAVTVCERIGNPDNTAWVLATLGSRHVESGEWDKAQEVLERALVMGRSIGSTGVLNALFQMGLLNLWRGDWEEASRYLQETCTSTQEADHPFHGPAQAHLAWLDLLQGRPKEAMTRLEPLVGRETGHPGATALLAWAHLQTDTVSGIERAKNLGLGAVQRMRDEQGPGVLVLGLYVQGMVLTRLEQWEEAGRVITEGLNIARSMPLPHKEGSLLVVEAAWWRGQGRTVEARGSLEQALAIFQHLGAKKDVERVQGMLAGLRLTP